MGSCNLPLTKTCLALHDFHPYYQITARVVSFHRTTLCLSFHISGCNIDILLSFACGTVGVGRGIAISRSDLWERGIPFFFPGQLLLHRPQRRPEDEGLHRRGQREPGVRGEPRRLQEPHQEGGRPHGPQGREGRLHRPQHGRGLPQEEGTGADLGT